MEQTVETSVAIAVILGVVVVVLVLLISAARRRTQIQSLRAEADARGRDLFESQGRLDQLKVAMEDQVRQLLETRASTEELRTTMESRARQLFDDWRSNELPRVADERAKVLFSEWQQAQSQRIREDAIRRSQSVIMGKVTEHLVPFQSEFSFDPRDARFLGTPIDLIVFDGLSAEDVKEIVFVEVKTGRASLSRKERSLQECIERRGVSHRVIRLPGIAPEPLVSAKTDVEPERAVPTNADVDQLASMRDESVLTSAELPNLTGAEEILGLTEADVWGPPAPPILPI